MSWDSSQRLFAVDSCMETAWRPSVPSVSVSAAGLQPSASASAAQRPLPACAVWPPLPASGVRRPAPAVAACGVCSWRE